MTTVPFPISIPSDSPFTIWNIPFGIFSTPEDQRPRPGTAIGDYVVDLSELARAGEFKDFPLETLQQGSLNAFSELGSKVRTEVRKKIQQLLQDSSSVIYDMSVQPKMLFDRAAVRMHLPFRIGDFTDCTCSLEHVTNMGRLTGKGGASPGFFHIPHCYNGRVSSIVVSGTPIRRPWGHIKGADDRVTFSKSQRFDYETELGFFISSAVPIGKLIPAEKARECIFGFVVLNDWSARDIQFFESNPLGPFNGKSSGTSISPWVITLEALEEVGALVTVDQAAAAGVPEPAPLLQSKDTVSIQVSTHLSRNNRKYLLAKSDLQHMYWSPFQLLANQTSSGSGMSSGDLIGTGTLSSSSEQAKRMPDFDSNNGRLGCLVEATEGWQVPLQLEHGEELTTLEDNDEIIMEAWAGTSSKRIGFGVVSGSILPAHEKFDF